MARYPPSTAAGIEIGQCSSVASMILPNSIVTGFALAPCSCPPAESVRGNAHRPCYGIGMHLPSHGFISPAPLRTTPKGEQTVRPTNPGVARAHPPGSP